jgi:hypothetical protein
MAWAGASNGSTTDLSAHPGFGMPASYTLGELLQNLAPALGNLAATLGVSDPSSTGVDTAAGAAAAGAAGGSSRAGPRITVEGLSDLTPDQQLHLCIKVRAGPVDMLHVYGYGYGCNHACMHVQQMVMHSAAA